MNGLYSNIGKKICGYAKALGVISIITLVIAALCIAWGLLDAEELSLVIGLIVAGSGLLLLIFSLIVFALGQITDDVRTMRIKINGEDQPQVAYNVYPANNIPVYTNGAYPVYQHMAQPNVQQVYQPNSQTTNQNNPT